jgi:FtsZ-binding cell division protein ZapB
MADEIDLRFLAEQGKRILDELAEARTERAEMRAELGQLGEVRAEQHALASLLGKVSDAVTEIAKVQERHSELLGKVYEIQQNNGARLNVIEGRLAIIERHTGLVKA